MVQHPNAAEADSQSATLDNRNLGNFRPITVHQHAGCVSDLTSFLFFLFSEWRATTAGLDAD